MYHPQPETEQPRISFHGRVLRRQLHRKCKNSEWWPGQADRSLGHRHLGMSRSGQSLRFTHQHTVRHRSGLRHYDLGLRRYLHLDQPG